MSYLLQVKLDEVIIIMKLIKKSLIFNTNEHNLDQSDQYIYSWLRCQSVVQPSSPRSATKCLASMGPMRVNCLNSK